MYLCEVKVAALTQMINFKNCWLLIITTLSLSCGDANAPEDLIERSKMVQVLTDIQITEAKLSRLSVRSFDSTVVAFNYLQAQIFDQYEVDSAAYIHSYEYYAGRPELFAEMFEQVEDNIAKLENEERESQAKNKPAP